MNQTQGTIGGDNKPAKTLFSADGAPEERDEANPHRMTLHDLQIQIQQLQGEKDELNRLNEELIQKLAGCDSKL